MTVVPGDYLSLLRHYPVNINGQVRDISKRAFSSHLVTRNDGYQGPVMVKTDRNCGGLPERMAMNRGRLARSLDRRLRRWLPWSWTGALNPHHYPVYDCVRQVPRLVWRNKGLVVEKFLPETLDGYYCLRQWVFLGDKEVNTLSLSREPVVKGANIVHREQVDFIPQPLRALRQQLGFDYGKFDYALVDGEPVLYDVNRTPKFGLNRPRPEVERMAREVAGGIGCFQGPSLVTRRPKRFPA
jgi:hypothetical protein